MLLCKIEKLEMRFILSLRMLLLCKNLLTKIISTILSDIIQIRYKACTQAGRSTTEPIYSACNNIKLFREQPRDNVFIPSYLNPIKARWVIDQHKGNLLFYILLQVFFFFPSVLIMHNPALQKPYTPAFCFSITFPSRRRIVMLYSPKQ